MAPELSLETSVTTAISDVVGHRETAVGLHEPWFRGRELEYARDCLETGWISSVGAYVNRFEEEVARACGAEFGVAVVNGTAALQVAFQLCGVAPGDEVILPSLTFVATANAVSHRGAVPHFVDSAEDTLGLCPEKLRAHLARVGRRRADGVLENRETGRRIAAVVPVHVFGNPVAMDALVALCDDLGLPVIEDSTEALGSSLDGRGCGSIGRVGTFSFNGNKILTTGGGGALVTNDGDLARRAKHLTTTAKLPHKWAFEHDEVAYNYRLPNLNAAVGCAQLEQLPYFLSLKKDLAAAYAEAFSTVAGVRFHGETKGAARNNWLNTLILDRDVADQRDAILQATHNAGYLTRPIWRLLHFLPMYAECPRADLSVAMDLERRVVNLPSSAWLAPALADETQTAER